MILNNRKFHLWFTRNLEDFRIKRLMSSNFSQGIRSKLNHKPTEEHNMWDDSKILIGFESYFLNLNVPTVWQISEKRGDNKCVCKLEGRSRWSVLIYIRHVTFPYWAVATAARTDFAVYPLTLQHSTVYRASSKYFETIAFKSSD